MTVHEVEREEHTHPADGEYARGPALFAALAGLPGGHPDRDRVRDLLVTEYLPLAEHIARRYGGRGEVHDDLVQVARLGLINAVDRFDVERGSEFLSFAVPTIMGEVRRYFRDSSWSVRVPRRLKELHLSISQATSALSARLGRAPTPSELAAELGLPVNEVREGLMAGNAYQAVSSDAPATRAPDAVPLADLMGEDDVEIRKVEEHEALQPLLRALPARERKILMLRFFGNMTQTQIAERMGISQMHVSRLLAQTLQQLREKMTED